MTPAQFRKTALGLFEAAESAHMGHPDFRVGGRIFATLSHPDERHGMVKLTAEQQADVMDADQASAFSPSAGAWGRRGATNVVLRAADQELVRIALEAAWKNVAPKTRKVPGPKARKAPRRPR
jgi:hypothetical protein